MKNIISTPNAPKAIGPYNQAVIVNNMLFTSGQIAINPTSGNLVEGGIEAQTRQVMSNLLAILKESGFSADDVIKTTVFIQSMNDFSTVNSIYGEFFTANNAPARSCVEASSLPKGALIEIELIASK